LLHHCFGQSLRINTINLLGATLLKSTFVEPGVIVQREADGHSGIGFLDGRTSADFTQFKGRVDERGLLARQYQGE
jgi:hypothetical protein